MASNFSIATPSNFLLGLGAAVLVGGISFNFGAMGVVAIVGVSMTFIAAIFLSWFIGRFILGADDTVMGCLAGLVVLGTGGPVSSFWLYVARSSYLNPDLGLNVFGVIASLVAVLLIALAIAVKAARDVPNNGFGGIVFSISYMGLSVLCLFSEHLTNGRLFT